MKLRKQWIVDNIGNKSKLKFNIFLLWFFQQKFYLSSHMKN